MKKDAHGLQNPSRACCIERPEALEDMLAAKYSLSLDMRDLMRM